MIFYQHSPGSRADQCGHDLDQRGLTSTIWTENRKKFPGFYIKINITKDRIISKRL
jgi:hypothetical protein